MKPVLLSIFLATLFAINLARAENEGAIIYSDDGTVKARQYFETKDGRILKRSTFDDAKNLEYTEIPTYSAEGRITQVERFAPDGSKWPYPFTIHGAHKAGGINELKTQIKEIQNIVSGINSSYSILEIEFKTADSVRIMSGVMRGMLNGGGEIYTLKKENGRWIQTNKNVSTVWSA